MTETDLAIVRLRTSSGRIVSLEPGHMIGRSMFAGLQLNEPGVSEAHALISLRGSSFKLLALRGRFEIDGSLATEVELELGMEITLAHGVTLTVVELSLPSAMLGIMGDDLARRVLPPVASLLANVPQLRPGFVAGYDALLWTDGDGFIMRRPGRADEEVAVGTTFTAGDRRFTLVAVPLSHGDMAMTEPGAAWDTPLTISARHDSVHIDQGGSTVVIGGYPARVLSELAVMGVPTEWITLATGLWPDESDETVLRRRWDRTIARLRQALRVNRIRADLLHADGRGRIELVLGPRDQVRDET